MVAPTIAFQGIHGAYSEQACREMRPDRRPLCCRSFEDIFSAIEQGTAELGMLPVENSVAGVVSDSYDLLATHDLHIVGEYYLRVRHALLATPGSSIEQIRTVSSHPQALAQCRQFLQQQGWQANAVYDTAGAACDLAQRRSSDEAAIASELCADLYGLVVLRRQIQDSDRNTTRFLLIASQPVDPPDHQPCKTSLLFVVKNIPAALYKCLGGFATNGINLTRLESRPVRGGHWHYHFYLDFQGQPEAPACRQALEELRFFTEQVKILGCYPAAVDDGTDGC
ncbi:MAG: prephenate dehydratase [Magnetococcales bacterium]|nr:prephenate dehydratase [Magnetococcales bacterium]